MVSNADVTKDTSLEDVAQICNTVGAATSVPKENSAEVTVSNLRSVFEASSPLLPSFFVLLCCVINFKIKKR